MAVFDAVVNNADRKIGHLLPDRGGRLYGCDHGVCFGEEYKLRTVLWQWRGRKLPARALDALPGSRHALATGATGRRAGPAAHRGRGEATRQRVELLLEHRSPPVPAGRLARRPLAAVLAGRHRGSPRSPRRRR